MNNLYSFLYSIGDFINDNIGLLSTTLVSIAGLYASYKTSKNSNMTSLAKSILEINYQNAYEFQINKHTALIKNIDAFNQTVLQPASIYADSYDDFIGAYNNLYVLVDDETRKSLNELKLFIDSHHSLDGTDIATNEEYIKLMNNVNVALSNEIHKIELHIKSFENESTLLLKDTLQRRSILTRYYTKK